MRRSLLPLLAALLTILAGPPAARAQTAADSAAIRAAVLDYVDAIYTGDTTLVARSVVRDMAKRGYARPAAGGDWRAYAMTYAQLVNTAKTWNRNGRVNPKTAPRRVTILDALDQVASTKLVAEWGVDYLHLAKHDGRWMIVNVVYQIAPSR